MAIICCPECQKSISDKSGKCIHCGFPLDYGSNNTPLQHEGRITVQARTTPKKTKVVLLIIIIAALAVSAVYYVVNYVALTEHEQYAVERVNDLKRILNDPDSLVLHDDVLVVYYEAKGKDFVETGYYTFIIYGATNAYGAMLRSSAIFIGSKYVGTMEDAQDRTNAEYSEERGVLLSGYRVFLSYQVGLDNIREYSLVDKDKIMRITR